MNLSLTVKNGHYLDNVDRDNCEYLHMKKPSRLPPDYLELPQGCSPHLFSLSKILNLLHCLICHLQNKFSKMCGNVCKASSVSYHLRKHDLLSLNKV